MCNKKIFVILGKSNTGKSTIFKELMNLIKVNNDDIKLLKSCTTRPKREEDNQDNEYEFVDKYCFTKEYHDNNILEYATYETVYGHWFYFTRKSDLVHDKYIKIINPSGLSQIRESATKLGYDVVAFHITSHNDIRMKRALSRNDGLSREEVERRFIEDEKDFKYIQSEYTVENNGDKTPREVAEIIYRWIKHKQLAR